jgi:hypothetical protein
LRPACEPGTNHVDRPAGQEPEGQQVDVLFAEIVYIGVQLPPSLFSK